jgi:hypothetical protein
VLAAHRFKAQRCGKRRISAWNVVDVKPQAGIERAWFSAP